MFPLTYAAKELRRRFGRTLLAALGLAAGVGLVIGIVGVSDGLDQAQGKVLAPLRSVGTDVLVTRVVGATDTGTATNAQNGQNGAAGQNAQPAQPGGGQGNGGQGGGGPGGFGGFFGGGGRGGGGGGAAGLNQADTLALANE